MAQTLWYRIQQGTAMGAYVYRSYKPQVVGVVTGFRQYEAVPTRWVITVRWEDGKEEDVLDFQLRDFEALAEEHRRKAEKYQAKLESLRRKEKHEPVSNP